jgi:hypothetical protein
MRQMRTSYQKENSSCFKKHELFSFLEIGLKIVITATKVTATTALTAEIISAFAWRACLVDRNASSTHINAVEFLNCFLSFIVS